MIETHGESTPILTTPALAMAETQTRKPEEYLPIPDQHRVPKCGFLT
jgi:hypothetical protein